MTQLVALHPADQNRAVLDPWTTVHFGVGMAAGLTGMPMWAALSAAVAYEFAEQAFEGSKLGQKVFATSGPESLPNAVADVAIFAVAWWLGRGYHARR